MYMQIGKGAKIMLEQYNDILTVAEVAEILLTGKNRIYDMVRDGSLSHLRMGKMIKIPKESVIEFIREGSGLHNR